MSQFDLELAPVPEDNYEIGQKGSQRSSFAGSESSPDGTELLSSGSEGDGRAVGYSQSQSPSPWNDVLQHVQPMHHDQSLASRLEGLDHRRLAEVAVGVEQKQVGDMLKERRTSRASSILKQSRKVDEEQQQQEQKDQQEHHHTKKQEQEQERDYTHNAFSPLEPGHVQVVKLMCNCIYPCAYLYKNTALRILMHVSLLETYGSGESIKDEASLSILGDCGLFSVRPWSGSGGLDSLSTCFRDKLSLWHPQ